MLADGLGNSVNLEKAILKKIKYTNKEKSIPGRSYLDLASANGLETVDFGNSDFLVQYVEDAFEYAHKEDLEEKKKYPDFVATAINKIKLLRQLYKDKEQPPPNLIKVVQTMTAELMKYFKNHTKELYSLKPRQFEELIAEIFASYGWDVQLTQSTRDGGYDIYAIQKDKSGSKTNWIIECKKNAQNNKVGVGIIRALYGTKLSLNVANALLATTSYFTKPAIDYQASTYNLKLKDYEGILEWINEYQPNPDGKLYIKDHKLVLPGEN